MKVSVIKLTCASAVVLALAVGSLPAQAATVPVASTAAPTDDYLYNTEFVSTNVQFLAALPVPTAGASCVLTFTANPTFNKPRFSWWITEKDHVEIKASGCNGAGIYREYTHTRITDHGIPGLATPHQTSGSDVIDRAGYVDARAEQKVSLFTWNNDIHAFTVITWDELYSVRLDNGIDVFYCGYFAAYFPFTSVQGGIGPCEG